MGVSCLRVDRPPRVGGTVLSVPVMRDTTRWWGVVKRPDMLLGGGWFPDHYYLWPRLWRTRAEAREAAKGLTAKFLYLRPTRTWEFRAVSVQRIIKW